MKIATTLLLSEEVLDAVDENAAEPDRSLFVETALWSFLRRSSPDKQAHRDAEILEMHANELNAEAADVLDYQVSW